MAQTTTRKPPSQSVRTFWFSVLAGFLLLIANSAIWVNNYIFDENNFSAVVTTAITSESSRQSIAEGITDKAFAERPVLKKVAGELSTKVISGVLGTTQANNAIAEATRRLNVVVTTNDPQPVVIDLSGVKSIVTQLVDVSAASGREPKVNPENIPDQVTLLDPANIPNFYRLGVAFLWIAPFAFIGGVAALAAPYLRRPRAFKPTLAIQGAVITGFGLLGLLVGPLFRPPLLANVKTTDGRVVVGNIYDGFITTFNAQTRLLVGFGLALLVVATVIYLYQVIMPTIKARRANSATKPKTARTKK